AVIEEALAKNAGIRVPTVGALADRIGAAYGLTGAHDVWARTTEAELGQQIEAGLPAAIERHAEDKKSAPSLGAMDAASRAGSEGGPAGGAFAEDMIMGVPKGPPKWIYAVVAGAVLLGLVVFLIAR